MEISTGEILTAALVFLRISALLFAMPFFGEQVVPVRVRIMLAVALSFAALGPSFPATWQAPADPHPLSLFLLMLHEVFVGIALGFVSKIIFEGLVMAAQLVGYQMGFGTANLLLPGSDIQSDSFTALHRVIVLLFFLQLGLHYIFINGIFSTFQVLPPGSASLSGAFVQNIVSATSSIFSTAIQLACPILVALLFAMAALGLVARTVPQMNVFTMSFPLSFFSGLLVYVGMMPFLPGWLRSFYAQKLSVFESTLGMLIP